MSENVLHSGVLPGTTATVANIILPEAAENQTQVLAFVQAAHPSNEPNGPLRITGEQTIRNADELRRALAERLDRGLDVILDLSGIQACDTAAIQLIYALRRSAIERKQRFEITAVSPVVIATAAAIGLRIDALTAACEPARTQSDCERAGTDNGI